VEVTDFPGIRLALEVPIQQAHGKEEGLVIALKVGKDFNHPIDHTSS
jgi:hypothetical protein